MNEWDMEYLGVMADMAGCPNRCRHCWLGSQPNGKMTTEDFRGIARQFAAWRDENDNGIRQLGFFSWWREPDYQDNYKELWKLEQELSSPGRAMRFELLSVWRLARDPSYAKWAATLEPKKCQISFFGMESATDWGCRRKGAYADNLLATERLLEVGMTPRWQLFLTKPWLCDLNGFLRLICELKLQKRCEAIGHNFEVFIGGISPEGNGFEIDQLRIDKEDLAFIPSSLIDICREGINLLGQPEHELLGLMATEDSPPNISANTPCVSINAAFDVYPNIAEPTQWWHLGNLRTDGIDVVMERYINQSTPGMKANREIPLCTLASRYGDHAKAKSCTAETISFADLCISRVQNILRMGKFLYNFFRFPIYSNLEFKRSRHFVTFLLMFYTRMRHDFPCRVGLYPPNSKPDRKMFLQTSISNSSKI